MGPLEPSIYDYCFQIQGVNITDPMNPYIGNCYYPFRKSLLICPGKTPMFYEERPIPHGVIHYHRYHSDLLGDSRGYYVYTPPRYEKNVEKNYPVLYLLHGYYDQEDAWLVGGRAQFIIDNLLHENKAVPMVIVMPNGYVPSLPSDGVSDVVEYLKRIENFDKFLVEWEEWFFRVVPRYESYFLQELIPRVEQDYRVLDEPYKRAIAGLSMGGSQALHIGLSNPDSFGWICSFSSGAYSDRFSTFLSDPENLNKQIKLLWIGCGKDDFLIENNIEFIYLLKEKKINHVARITEGKNSLVVWTKYLHETEQLLFK